MEEPPDPGGSIPLVPQPACFVTVSNESGMETDGSVASTSGRNLKRPRPNKLCRHCNKRKHKRNSSAEYKETDCTCIALESTNDKPIKTTPPIPTNPLTTTNTRTEKSEIQSSQPQLAPIGRAMYEVTDMAPYIVHIQKQQTNPDDSTTLHPIAFGKFLQRQNFQNIVNGSLKRIGRNRMSIAFTHYDKANQFLKHDSLNKNQFKAFIPTFNVTRMGLVRGVPAEWSPEEVVDNINVPIGCGKIIKIRRLNYRTTVDGSPTWKPSQTVVLTFDGQVLPKRIYMCYNALPVELYTYPTVQCYSCARFGHTKVQCRSKPRCYKCGFQHTADTCKVEENKATCCLCSGNHFATSKCCPELDRQRRIKQSMAESCISYAEANKLHAPVSKSFAEVVSSSPASSTNKLISPSPTSTSYKKTVTRQARSPPHVLQGYDRSAHHEIIKGYNMPCHGKGCGYQTGTSGAEEHSITDMILTLINTLSQSTLLKPDHAAHIIDTLQKIIHFHNGCSETNNEQV